MKTIEILGLICVAAILTAGLITAETAPAVTICKEKQVEECPKAQRYPKETKFTGVVAEEATSSFKMGETTASCEKSTIGFETTAESAEILPGKLTSLTFGSCGSCTVEAMQLPYAIEVQGTAQGHGTFKVATFEKEEEGEEKPGVRIKCFGGLLNCVYKAQTFQKNWNPKGEGELGLMIGSEEPLEKTEGGALCAAEARWNSEYELTEPKTIWISRNP